MKNTPDNKLAFVASYYGQRILINEKGKTRRIKGLNLIDIEVNLGHLLLKPLSNITLEDAEEIANMAFKTGDKIWEVTRRTKNGVWMHGTRNDDIDITYYCHISDYGGLFTSSHFPKDEKQEAKKYDNNIGSVGNSDSNGLPYIDIVDTLRRKGYAIPYRNKLVRDLVKWGWVKLEPSIF